MISDEKFFAWLDGELEPGEAAAIDELVAADPELQRRAEAHRALAGRLVERLRADRPSAGSCRACSTAIRPREAEVIDFSAAREQRAVRSIPVRMQWAAMAATLAIGIVAGSMINGGPATPIVREDGRLVASGELEQALYTRLASAPADKGARIGLTFRDAAGDLCRSFTDDGAAGTCLPPRRRLADPRAVSGWRGPAVGVPHGRRARPAPCRTRRIRRRPASRWTRPRSAEALDLPALGPPCLGRPNAP